MTDVKEPESADPQTCFRILILGDGFREEIRQACLDEGYEVVTVKNSNEAFKFLESRDHVDAAIVPAFMEQGTVFDFLLGMRRMPENLTSPIMILSAEPSQMASFCSPAVEAAAKLLGAYKFVTMPEFDLKQVIRELKVMLPDVPSKCSNN